MVISDADALNSLMEEHGLKQSDPYLKSVARELYRRFYPVDVS